MLVGALSVFQSIVTLLLLNLFLMRVPLPGTAATLRRAALPWLWGNLVVGVGFSVWQGALARWVLLPLFLAMNLYVTWLLWKFGLRKQFPHERPLG